MAEHRTKPYRRRKTLAEQEFGFLDDQPPQWLLDEIKKNPPKSNKDRGLSDDLADYRWTGGRDGLEARDRVEERLIKIAALKAILLAIIDAHPNVETLRRRPHKRKEQRLVRLEQVIHLLIGRPPQRGAPKPNYEPILKEVALRYWRALIEFNAPPTTLARIIKSVLHPEIDPDDSAFKDIDDDEIAPLRSAFNRDKHRLLLEASDGMPIGSDSPELDRIIAMMGWLGILDPNI